MTDYSLFFGAFHPVVVHLPIGGLIVAVAVQGLSFVPRLRALSAAVPWLYGLAVAGGLVAVASGWLLAGPAGDSAWDTHRWWGLGALALCALSTYASASRLVPAAAALGLGAATVAVTGWAGHLGGGLVHGEGHFAQYAPEGVAALVGGERDGADANREPIGADPDSVYVYPTLVAPMLSEHCVDCHRADLRRGGLRLDSYAAVVKGGREGGGLSTGSELWRRVSLPPDHPRYMPSRGEPLSYDELTILRAWLRANPDSTATVTEVAEGLDAEAYDAIARRYRLNVRPQPYVERARPAPVDVADDLQYWDISPLSQRHTTLVARLVSPGAEGPAAIAELSEYASNVTALDLSGLTGADDWVTAMPPMPHLTRLDLSSSDAGDRSVAALKAHPHLETVKLTSTQVTDAGADALGQLPALKRVYLYGTDVTPGGIAALADVAPDRLTVVGRIDLPAYAPAPVRK